MCFSFSLILLILISKVHKDKQTKQNNRKVAGILAGHVRLLLTCWENNLQVDWQLLYCFHVYQRWDTSHIHDVGNWKQQLKNSRERVVLLWQPATVTLLASKSSHIAGKKHIKHGVFIFIASVLIRNIVDVNIADFGPSSRYPRGAVALSLGTTAMDSKIIQAAEKEGGCSEDSGRG